MSVNLGWNEKKMENVSGRNVVCVCPTTTAFSVSGLALGVRSSIMYTASTKLI